MYELTLKKKYILALVLTGLYAVISNFTTVFLINNSYHSFEDMNLLGKERMLSGKILFYTNEVYHHYSFAQVEKLKEAIAEFKEIEITLKAEGIFLKKRAKKSFLTWQTHL